MSNVLKFVALFAIVAFAVFQGPSVVGATDTASSPQAAASCGCDSCTGDCDSCTKCECESCDCECSCCCAANCECTDCGCDDSNCSDS